MRCNIYTRARAKGNEKPTFNVACTRDTAPGVAGSYSGGAPEARVSVRSASGNSLPFAAHPCSPQVERSLSVGPQLTLQFAFAVVRWWPENPSAAVSALFAVILAAFATLLICALPLYADPTPKPKPKVTAASQLPFGIQVPGKPNLVYSPYAKGKIIDVAPDAPALRTIYETQKLTPSNGNAYSFGTAVSISGNLAIVGDWGDTDKGFDSGAAYFFAFDGTSWNLQVKVTGSEEVAGDQFGRAVAISGNTALVGAPSDSTLGLNAGAVYVFTFDGTTWTQQAKLFASDPQQAGLFGISLSLVGNTALIGAQEIFDHGSAYVFTFDGTSWSQQAKLTATDGNSGDYFGWSVSLSGNRALIGAYGNAYGYGLGGAAYVFSSDGTTWSQEAKLTGLDTRQDDSFGWALSISGDVALVGAPDRGSGRGAGYVFGFDGATWTQQTKLTIPGATPADSFGSSVVLSDRVALIGARHFRDPGKVYEFALRRNTWTLRAQLLASDGMAGNDLGVSVALSGNTVLAGADDAFTSNGTGNAYIFSLGR